MATKLCVVILEDIQVPKYCSWDCYIQLAEVGIRGIAVA